LKRLLVYIAGPYTNPEPVENTRKAIDAWKVLVDAGYLPFVPHLTLLVQLVYPHDPDFWYALDIDFLEHCDVLLRLPGESWGADREVEFCKERGIPVFEGSAEEFIVYWGREIDTHMRLVSEVEVKPIIKRRRAR